MLLVETNAAITLYSNNVKHIDIIYVSLMTDCISIHGATVMPISKLYQWFQINCQFFLVFRQHRRICLKAIGDVMTICRRWWHGHVCDARAMKIG